VAGAGRIVYIMIVVSGGVCYTKKGVVMATGLRNCPRCKGLMELFHLPGRIDFVCHDCTVVLRLTKEPNVHEHQCPRKACRWVWEHDANDLIRAELAGEAGAYDRGHRCPKCGAFQKEHYVRPAYLEGVV
jgi:hypothetical protein